MQGGAKIIHISPVPQGKHLTVEEMDLAVSIRNALRRGGVDTLAQLLQLTHVNQ